MMAAQIEDHLERCKMDFASTVTLGPLNQNTETRLKNLVETKEGLETKVKNLQGQLAQMREVLAAQSEALNNRSRQNTGSAQMANNGQNRKPDGASKPANVRNNVKSSTPAIQQASITRPKYRKHVIRSKDTFYNLAKHYGVDFKSIQSANPGVNTIKLQIGQVVNIPYPTKTQAR